MAWRMLGLQEMDLKKKPSEHATTSSKRNSTAPKRSWRNYSGGGHPKQTNSAPSRTPPTTHPTPSNPTPATSRHNPSLNRLPSSISLPTTNPLLKIPPTPSNPTRAIFSFSPNILHPHFLTRFHCSLRTILIHRLHTSRTEPSEILSIHLHHHPPPPHQRKPHPPRLLHSTQAPTRNSSSPRRDRNHRPRRRTTF